MSEVSVKDITDLEYAEILDNPFLGKPSFVEAVNETVYTSQVETMARLLNRENVFISGPAGSGKSFIINRFVHLIEQEFKGNINVAVTSSTGVTAQLLGGRTIHSWSGIGINCEDFDRKPTGVEMSARHRITQCHVLIIDEISMLPAYFFTRLNLLMKHFRHNNKPFGGVQLIVMGDFLQLPPVSGRQRKEDGEAPDSRFCVYTDAWKEAKFKSCYLDVMHRAKDDKLKKVLRLIANDVNVDKISEDERIDLIERILSSRVGIEKSPDKQYVNLYTTNKDVDKYNLLQLARNPSKEYVFETHILTPRMILSKENFNNMRPLHYELDGDPTFDVRTPQSQADEKLLKTFGTPQSISLKVGATVMLTMNLNEKLANGNVGVVRKIDPTSVGVQFNNGEWASIEYKDRVLTEKIQVSEHVDSDGVTVKVFEEIVKYAVCAIPLKLAYAISVHKSQGQTLDGVETDLSKIFTEGLGYVALSRVASLDDLILTNMPNKKAYMVKQDSERIARAVKKASRRHHKFVLKNIEHFANLGDADSDVVSYEKVLTDPDVRSKIWKP